ncbi:replication-relaxation family protein [Streptomyces sp. NBC_01231]|nr:replication-relaxation family protein [Streptomyces sp. NBC_01231]
MPRSPRPLPGICPTHPRSLFFLLWGPGGWIPAVLHRTGNGESVIFDALLYYQRGPSDGDSGSMLRAFVEVDRATMGPERLAAKLPAYERLYRFVPAVPGRRPTLQEAGGVAALPALPPRPVRPGRHRTRRCREPDQRPARGSRAADAGPFPCGMVHAWSSPG